MIYLSIHSIKDGRQIFHCGTRYDWYLIQHTSKYTTTIVNDEKNNNEFVKIRKLTAKVKDIEKRCEEIELILIKMLEDKSQPTVSPLGMSILAGMLKGKKL